MSAMDQQKIKRLKYLRESGSVERCHCIPHNSSYTVGKHCYDMVVLLMQLFPGDPSTALIKSVLYHDAHERTLGDLPATAKWDSPCLRAEYQKIGRAHV